MYQFCGRNLSNAFGKESSRMVSFLYFGSKSTAKFPTKIGVFKYYPINTFYIVNLDDKKTNEFLLRDHKAILTTYTTSPHLSIIINHKISQKENESGFVPLGNEISF